MAIWTTASGLKVDTTKMTDRHLHNAINWLHEYIAYAEDKMLNDPNKYWQNKLQEAEDNLNILIEEHERRMRPAPVRRRKPKDA